MGFVNKLLHVLRRERHLEQDKAVVKGFRKRYASFRRLLDANSGLAELMADVETKLHGNVLFGLVYIRNTARRAEYLAKRMVSSLQAMNPSGYTKLTDALADVSQRIAAILGHQSDHEDCPVLTMPLTEITLDHVDWVGGKSANLGQMNNVAHVPVPRGFAVTIGGYRTFMAHEGLEEKIMHMLAGLNPEDRDAMAAILADVRQAIAEAPLPPALERAIKSAYQDCFGDEEVSLSVRSSAQAEDGAKSYAGQFDSELNVHCDQLPASYKRVVASMFKPAATLYRLHQGVPLNSNEMAVLCLEMVDAVSSGIVYSHDPVNLLNETVVINSVWGLGKYAVEGLVPPDLWVLTREEPPALVRRRAGQKSHMLSVDGRGELVDCPVPEGRQKEFTLTEEEAVYLAKQSLELERVYGKFQDVEWAKSAAGRIMFLQSRALDTRSGSLSAPKPPRMENYPLLLEGVEIACQGVGHGSVVHASSPEDLAHFPEGGVLVALHSNAEYAQVMDKAQAIITENGGITGHMATLCREFHVPCILNVPQATEILSPGLMVTVDAFNGYVYEGVVPELLPLRLQLDSVRLMDTEVHALLREVADCITPLSLTDPHSAEFSPEHCKTLHDIMRFVHEQSYQEMFVISDEAADAGGVALKLEAPLPIDLHIIDLDGGTKAAPHARKVKPEEILCAPLRAMLHGMLRPDTMFRKPRPINMSGFLSVIGQQMATPHTPERFGDKSYAIISDRYMNFSSRVGYHYSVLDAYCGNTASKNYISFSFQGGAAGEIRRERRCRAIALVLEALGFTVQQQGDMVKSSFQKYDKKMIEDRMDQIGRLLQVTRQMDMLMADESNVARFKNDFMQGVYY